MKKSYVMYSDWHNTIMKMSDEQAGKIFKKISNYHQENYENNDTDEMTDLIFSMFEASFIRDKKKYETIKNTRSELGKLGGLAKARLAKQKLAKASKSKKPLANLADSVSDSVSVSVNENVSVSDIKKENINSNIKEKTDEPSPVKKQNREDLLLIFEIVKNANGGISDDSGDNIWFIAGHLLNKLKKIDVVVSGQYTRDKYLESLLVFAKQNKYVVNYTTSLEKIYYNLAKLREGAKSIALEHKKPESYVFE